MSVFHNLQTDTEGIHQIHNWEYADSAARTGASGFTSDDLNKIALQVDDYSLWILTAITPTWVQLNAGTTTFLGLTDTPSSFSGYGSYALAVNGGETAIEFIPFPSGGDHTLEDGVTAAVTDVVSIIHNSTGTPANGFGTGMLFGADDGYTEGRPVGALSWQWSNLGQTWTQFRLYNYYYTYRQIVGVISSPDAYAVDGAARGRGSIDFQTFRGAAAEVASGPYSLLIGGSRNSAGYGGVGDYATVVGGYNNEALRGFIFGGLNNYSGQNRGSVVGGSGNAVNLYSGNGYAFIGGGKNNDINENYGAIVSGNSNTINGRFGFIGAGAYNTIGSSARYGSAFGNRANTTIRSTMTLASGRFTSDGDAQTIFANVKRSVTHSDTNWYELYVESGGPTRLIIPSDTVWTFDALISGASAGLVKSFSFRIEGAIKNDGGTTTLMASTVTTIDDSDDTSFDARTTADDTNDALLIEVTDSDATGDTVKWQASVRMSAVTAA